MPEPALPVRVRAEIASNDDTGGGSFRLRLRVPGWPGSAPGQFVMLSPGAEASVPRLDPLLPRPMAVYRASGREVEVFYKVTGRGTALLAEAPPGAGVRLTGPLGQPFPLPAPGVRAVLVGGGTGVASLHDLAVAAAARGPVSVLLGARSAPALMARADFEALPVELRIATDDGSAGQRGVVSDLLGDLLGAADGALVYACGPTPMMRRVAELAAEAGVRCVVSLENRMACGYGVCLGCAVPRAAAPGYALVCREGPIFEASSLAWEGVP